MARLDAETPATVRTSLLGAHAVPAEFAADPDGYVELICEEMIPAAAHRTLGNGDDPVIDLQVEVGLQGRLHVPDRLLRGNLGCGEKMNLFDLPPRPGHDPHLFGSAGRVGRAL